jgi:hypothetical protein
MKATYYKYLQFKLEVLHEKETWFIEEEGKTGIESEFLRGLSIDDRPDYEEKLQWTCANRWFRQFESGVPVL